MNKTILITGASSGVGKETAKLFAANNWNVIATMRNTDKGDELKELDNVLVTKLDVQDINSIDDAIAKGVEAFGKIDVLLNNAGFGQFGIFETIDPMQIKAQFEVNVFGVMNSIRSILPHFRAKNGGQIINVSSVGGRIAIPSISIYVASKFALEGFLESIAYELRSQNITIKIIEPFGISTNFHKVAAENMPSNDHLRYYDQFKNDMAKVFPTLQNARVTPQEVAAVIYASATDTTDTLRYVVGEEPSKWFEEKNSMPDQKFMDLMKQKFKA